MLSGLEVASTELESFTDNILVCSTLWFCVSLISETGGKKGQKKEGKKCAVCHCVQESRNKTDV